MEGLITRQYDECAKEAIGRGIRRPNQREILIDRQTRLEQQLSEVKAALDFFDKNPSFEQGLDILSKALL